MKYSKEEVAHYLHVLEQEHYESDPCIYDAVERYVARGESILELGSGPGIDYERLSAHYQVTGSDYSEEFLKILRQRFSKEFLHLDARTLEIEKTFSAIYSNKVLHHFNLDELKSSFTHQAALLDKKGIVIHSFWNSAGGEIEKHKPTGSYDYTHTHITAVAPDFLLRETILYEEFDAQDSFLVVLEKT